MKFAFIAAEKAWAPVAVLCKVLDVSRSGFYAWDERGRSTRSSEDAKLTVHVLAAFKVGRGAYPPPPASAHARGSVFGHDPRPGSVIPGPRPSAVHPAAIPAGSS